MKLEKLTKQQEQLMEEVKNEWLDGFFKNKFKFDEQKVKDGFKWLYKFSGLKEPQVIILDSPLGCQYAWNQVRNQVENQVRNQVGNQVRNQVENQVWNQVKKEKLKFYDWGYRGDIWDFGWVSFYDFFERIGIVKNSDFIKFKELIKLGVFVTIQTENYCFVSKYPTKINRDSQNRLHSESEPIIEFADGYKLYFIHGVFIPEEMFKKIPEMTAKEVLAITNAEQKMAILSVAGADKIIKDLKGKLIHKNETTGDELYEIEGMIPNKKVRICKYYDWSTRRVYVDYAIAESVEINGEKFEPHNTTEEFLAWRHYFSLNGWQDALHA